MCKIVRYRGIWIRTLGEWEAPPRPSLPSTVRADTEERAPFKTSPL